MDTGFRFSAAPLTDARVNIQFDVAFWKLLLRFF